MKNYKFSEERTVIIKAIFFISDIGTAECLRYLNFIYI